MTTAQEAYERYLIKVEKNSTNNNIATDRMSCVIMYNELKNRVIKWYLNNKDKVEIKDIQVLLVDWKRVAPERIHLNHVDFKLPSDFLSNSYIQATGSLGKCKEQDIWLYEVRPEELAQVLNNEYFKPSFEYRECPYTFSNDKINIYIEEGMKIDSIHLTYYRYPNKIALKNEDDPDSPFDENYNIELPDEVLDRVISAISGDFKINTENQAFQLDKLREKENLNLQ